jgi:transposase
MSGRVEIITGPERRRRWSDEEKLQLVAEACRAGNSVSRVARQRGIGASQLFGWRRQALAKGLITDNRSAPSAAPALTFSPVEVVEEPAIADAGELLLLGDTQVELHHHGAASHQMPLERVDVFETLLPDPAVRLPSSDFIPGRPMTWMRRRSSLGVASLRCQAFA